MKVLELYSGIGGMHFALKGSSLNDRSEIITAVDLNPVCNDIYRHNFPTVKLCNKNIVSLSAEDINILSPDMILMSPPCQPFTRLGKQKDVNDTRNDSFLQFLKLLPELTSVAYILIENVKGFEVSETRRKLLIALEESGFTYEEYLLNARQFGICNSRLRYYLLGKKASKYVNNSKDIIYDLPADYEEILKKMVPIKIPECVSTVLEHHPFSKEWDAHLVPDKYLKKYLSIMDIVGYDSKNSCCFTRGYTRYLEGTGSILTSVSENERENIKKELISKSVSCEKGKADEELIRKLKLRYFTPREIARLMTFSDSFSFPDYITLKQRYKVLCNSINVFVVSFLISYLIKDSQ